MGILSFLKNLGHNTSELAGFKIAILATNGVEESELTEPRKAFDHVGAKTYLVSPVHGTIQAWHNNRWGSSYSVDVTLDKADVRDYNALFLPGGVMNPDTLRMNPQAVAFVKGFFEVDKPIAAICHGPWLLVEAGILGGRKITSWPSLKTDVRNAGGTWVDEEVVIDDGLITSRKPDDIPAFSKAALDQFVQYAHRAKEKE